MGIALYFKWCALKNIFYLLCAGGRAIKEVTKSCLTFCFDENKIDSFNELNLKKKKKGNN